MLTVGHGTCATMPNVIRFGQTDSRRVETERVVERGTVFKMWCMHGRLKVHDYFLLLLCKSSISFTEKHIFKIIIYFLIGQNVPQIMSFHLRYMMVS